MELEGSGILDHDGEGGQWRDTEAALDGGDIHVLVEREDDGRVPDNGMVAIGDAGIDRQRRGQRPGDQPSRRQHQDDWENPPATPERRSKPAFAGHDLSHQGNLSRVLRPAAQAISRTLRIQLQGLSGLLSALAMGFLPGRTPLGLGYATIRRGSRSC